MASFKKTLAAFALTSALMPAGSAMAGLIVDGHYTLQQVSNSRFLDAYTTSNDYAVVTRPKQEDGGQHWIFTHLGDDVYSIVQVSGLGTWRYLDAYTSSGNDYGAVTRDWQGNTTQQWKIKFHYAGPNMPSFFSLQQVANGRYLDAHESASEDYRVVTRGDQNNLTQRWWIRVAAPTPPPTR
jgi:hypothetical protein